MFLSVQRSSAERRPSTICSPACSTRVTLHVEPQPSACRPAGIAILPPMTTDIKLRTDKIVRPDKDRFLNEDNPFEEMMSRFDHAAELLDLEPGLYKILRTPEKQITISIPVQMDNGDIEVFTGYRVLHNTSRGPAKGGIRFDSQVNLDEVKALAAW